MIFPIEIVTIGSIEKEELFEDMDEDIIWICWREGERPSLLCLRPPLLWGRWPPLCGMGWKIKSFSEKLRIPSLWGSVWADPSMESDLNPALRDPPLSISFPTLPGPIWLNIKLPFTFKFSSWCVEETRAAIGISSSFPVRNCLLDKSWLIFIILCIQEMHR